MGILSKLKTHIALRRDAVGYWRGQGAKIGEGCEIYPSVILGSEPYLVEIGDHVRITDGVTVITHDGGVWVLRYLKEEYHDIDLFKRVRIGNNVHIGTNAIIMPGVTIGSNCIIGCGAVVTKDIPDNAIAVGVPARVIESVDEFEGKYRERFVHTKQMSAEEKKQFLLTHIQK